MLKFVDLARRMPDKRAAGERRADFDEIYQEFDAKAAAQQASRCSQCGVPFCQVHCPLHNNIPDWLMMTAEGRLEEAYELAQATNNFPEICGRICPQDRLCEGNCVIEQAGHGTVTIGTVEKYITETAWDRGLGQAGQARLRELEESVGIVGAGPAGLAAAEELRRQAATRWWSTTATTGSAGCWSTAFPTSSWRRQVVERRADLIAEGGVSYPPRASRSASDATLEELRQRHDALLIATGVYQARDIKVPGVGIGNVSTRPWST